MEPDDKGATINHGPPAFDGDAHDDPGSLIGTDIGGYIVEGELGRGGMGVVFAATHPMIGKRVAIKVLKPSLSNNPATVERFVQEARSVNQIGHPNIVDIFAFGKLPDGRSYLIMDLLVGESLRKRVKRGPLVIEDVVRILDEVGSALAAAHAKGFIHRDLKPDNVYLVDHPARFDIKLLDFGLAKLLVTGGLSARAFRTATGAMLGTPDYMSPEQLKGTGVDHRTDIYALGVVAFEMLAGERPRRYSDGTFELDGMTVSPFLATRCNAPQELSDLVEAMLAPESDARPSMEAVRAVLKRAKHGVAGPARAIEKPAPGDSFEARTTPAGRPLSDAGRPSSGAGRSTSGAGPEISASLVGARPVVATPVSGAPTIQEMPSYQPQYVSQQPQYVSQQPQYVSQQPQYTSQQPQYASLQPQHGGLAKSAHPATKLGVAPPPERSSKPHPVTAARSGGSKLWLVIGLGLVVVSAAALIFVLAT